MTREEHIYQLKQYLQGKSISMCPSSSLYWREHWEEVIKALEQEPILDKIRAEINNLTVYYTTKDKGINLISQNAVNRILDKYKGETEDT